MPINTNCYLDVNTLSLKINNTVIPINDILYA
jgi:hypothetical protein